MAHQNEVSLTTVSIIVIFSLCFFALTFFGAIHRFQDAIREQSLSSIYSGDTIHRSANPVHDQCFINSTTGPIQGHLLVVNGIKVCEYIGIPYARPPVGRLRFKRPLPVTGWSKTWIADEWAASCIQTFPDWANFMMRRVVNETNEDCLYLNVWSPMGSEDSKDDSKDDSKEDSKDDAEELRPIIFWIHGGGYQFGSGTLEETNGSTLAVHADTVIVTVNYRLNAFGFLNLQSFMGSQSLDDPSSVQGNQGLYDQAMALDWIRSNGNKFNGDQSRITLWGQGMGGMSISIHLISPLMRNRFQRAIIQTGTMFTSRQMYSNGDSVGEQFIHLLGCDAYTDGDYDQNLDRTETDEESEEEGSLVNCIQKKSVEEILTVTGEMNRKNPISFLFTPFQPFLNSSSPLEIKSDLRHHINPTVTEIIFGFNSDEGSLLLNSLLPQVFPSKSDRKVPNVSSVEEAKEILTKLFVERLQVAKAVIDVGISSAFSSVSTSSSSDSEKQKIVKSMVDFVGNNIFVCPTILYAQEVSNQVKNVSVHLYTYTKRSSYNKLPDWFGTIHNEEVPIMFGHPLRFPQEYTLKEIEFSKKMMELIGNFARNGKVTNWPEYSTSNQKYLDINPNEFKIGTGINDKDCSLFEIGMDLA